MRIGHYCSTIWAPGGIATYIRTITDWQRDSGHAVTFLTGADGTPVDPGGRVAECVANGSALLSRAATLKLDLLHTHLLVNADLRASPVPVVRTVHGHQPYCPSGSRFLKRTHLACDRHYSLRGCVWGHLIDRCGSARPARLVEDFRQTKQEMSSLQAVQIVVVSNFLKLQLLAEGYPVENLHTIYPPVISPKNFERALPIEPRFAFVGRLAPEKGINWLLRSMKAATVPSTLDIIGDGPEMPFIQTMINNLGLAGRTRWHGWLDRFAKDRLVAGATAFIFPSIWHEPFGLVASEAMALGVPVIGSRVGGIPELITDRQSGLLVDPNNIAALAAAMDQLAINPKLARELGDNAREEAAKKFAIDFHMSRLMAVYKQASAGRGGVRAA